MQLMRLKLYWCKTEDHHEDWFVVARRARDAIRLFSRHEGYDKEEVVAKVVMILPDPFQDEKYLGWPTRELLEACGAAILRWDTPRVVELKGRRWVEGMLEHQILTVTDDLFERKGQGRPNHTRRDSNS